MMKGLSIFILGLALLSLPVKAQEPETQTEEEKPSIVFPTAFPCQPTVKLFDELIETYKEQPIALGLGLIRSAQTGQFYKGKIALWAGETGSWTMTISPDGDETSCIVISGEGLQLIGIPPEPGIKL